MNLKLSVLFVFFPVPFELDRGLNSIFSFSGRPVVTTSSDLINSGLNVMLKFALKFIEKAWQSGTDASFCSEMLSEAVTMFSGVKKVLLFNSDQQLPVLGTVMKEGTAFLEKFIEGYRYALSETVHTSYFISNTSLKLAYYET